MVREEPVCLNVSFRSHLGLCFAHLGRMLLTETGVYLCTEGWACILRLLPW
ncbi:hypothetical protein RB213_005272 [Colletotrichum asianum]